MKVISRISIILFMSLLATSCELDNYDAPDARIHGSFVDFETGELVEQDIVNGVVIEFVETGYTQIQTMIVKNDGTYRNNLIFSGEYTFTPKRGNFEPLEPQIVQVKGDTKLDFVVKPFVRISNVEIFRNGDYIKAVFTVKQTGYDPLSRVALFAFSEPSVGHSINSAQIEIPVGKWLGEETTYSIQIPINNSNDKKSVNPIPGKPYFFRVGAIADVPEAKYNYAPAVRIDF